MLPQWMLAIPIYWLAATAGLFLLCSAVDITDTQRAAQDMTRTPDRYKYSWTSVKKFDDLEAACPDYYDLLLKANKKYNWVMKNHEAAYFRGYSREPGRPAWQGSLLVAVLCVPGYGIYSSTIPRGPFGNMIDRNSRNVAPELWSAFQSVRLKDTCRRWLLLSPRIVCPRRREALCVHGVDHRSLGCRGSESGQNLEHSSRL
ncbi:hypothetical protein K402DRAFT_429808 [Aulographum hederae CBS 113979]|uniref:Uncharacterized protein n=1 Tax=Aulographum hederae CBS 113979 TaxID=1176131 RepID=A0A6G1H231_9PEZI|nr:hypothetical protein K402DRAFT_429808 [Aulographum hederae CBS 113979]